MHMVCRMIGVIEMMLKSKLMATKAFAEANRSLHQILQSMGVPIDRPMLVFSPRCFQAVRAD